jgi:hypothetical protein
MAKAIRDGITIRSDGCSRDAAWWHRGDANPLEFNSVTDQSMRPLNQRVAGSSPAAPTIVQVSAKQAEITWISARIFGAILPLARRVLPLSGSVLVLMAFLSAPSIAAEVPAGGVPAEAGTYSVEHARIAVVDGGVLRPGCAMGSGYPQSS